MREDFLNHQASGERRIATLVARTSGWLTIAVGAVHVAFTARDFAHPSLEPSGSRGVASP